MTSKYRYQKNKIILVIVLPLFIFISLITFLIYEKEKAHIIENENLKIDTEISLLGNFLSDSILKRDYAEAKNFLNSWVKEKDEIRNLEVVFSNGKKFSLS